MLEIQLKKSVEIIAEAGCNHGGDLEDAKLLVRAAAECGADYIKFQTYLSQNLINPGGELLKFCKKAELSFADHLELIRCCKENNIGFLASSAAAEVLKSEFEKKIERTKDEIILLETKLKMLQQEQ